MKLYGQAANHSNSWALVTKPYDRSHQSSILIAARWYFPQKFPMREGGSEGNRDRLAITTKITAQGMGFGGEIFISLYCILIIGNKICQVKVSYVRRTSVHFSHRSCCPKYFIGCFCTKLPSMALLKALEDHSLYTISRCLLMAEHLWRCCPSFPGLCLPGCPHHIQTVTSHASNPPRAVLGSVHNKQALVPKTNKEQFLSSRILSTTNKH